MVIETRLGFVSATNLTKQSLKQIEKNLNHLKRTIYSFYQVKNSP
jgi:hypothetical protein